VFILKDLIALICTKIVQVSEMLQTKGLELSTGSKSKNASKMLALRWKDAIISGRYYIPRVSSSSRKKWVVV